MNGTNDIRPDDFTERVMAALSPLPDPSPTRALVEALRTRSLHDAWAALSVAWHLGTVRSWPIAPRVRARSFALVLAAVTLLGTGSLAAAAAVHVVSSAAGGQLTVEPAGAVPAAPDPTSAGPLESAAETPAPSASEPVLEDEPSVGPEPTRKATADHDKATSKDGSTKVNRPRRTDDPADRGSSPPPRGDDGDDDASDDGDGDGDEDDDGADDDPAGSGGDDGSDEDDSVDGDGWHE